METNNTKRTSITKGLDFNGTTNRITGKIGYVKEMKVKGMSKYHKTWDLELDKIGERVTENILIECNGITHRYKKIE